MPPDKVLARPDKVIEQGERFAAVHDSWHKADKSRRLLTHYNSTFQLLWLSAAKAAEAPTLTLLASGASASLFSQQAEINDTARMRRSYYCCGLH
jgi:hypothetical protein